MITRYADYKLFSGTGIISQEGDLSQFALLADAEPIDFVHAMKDEIWREAMRGEMKFIEPNQTWELVKFPFNKQRIDLKWVYKLKLRP